MIVDLNDRPAIQLMQHKSPPWHILLVDDDEDDFIITQTFLHKARGRKITLDWAPTFSDGLTSLRTRQYDAVLIDYDLGNENGIAFIRAAAAQDYPAPMILYTGRGSHTTDLEAMEVGATLYLTKSETNPMLLERSIRYAIERKHAERALRESEERYRNLFRMLEQRVQERTAELKKTKELFERLFQSAPDATLLVNPEGKITRLNREAERLFGYAADELIGERIETLVPERFRNLHKLFRAGYTSLPAIRRMGERPDIYGLRKNGGEFLVDIMLSPVEIAGELNVICMVREIVR